MANSPDTPAIETSTASAFAAVLVSFLIWGLANPIYFKLLGDTGPVEIVAHRVVWTVVLVGIGVLALKGPRAIAAAVGSWRRLGVFLVSTLLVTANWTIFIWAIGQNRLVEASLGYYINPLVNVLLGVVFLGERLNRGQLAAVAIATLAVAILVAAHGAVPWVALALALSFGFYALVRKKAAIDPVVGLLVETLLLLPAALAYLLWLGSAGSFGHTAGGSLLLVLAGPVTAVPLVLFMTGAAKLKLSTVGVLQYLSPTCQLLLGVLVYGEPFTTTHALAFGCIWLALLVFSADALSTHRAAARAAAE